MEPAKKLCQHCNEKTRRTSGGNRGLCSVCYNNLDVREMYPPMHRYEQEGEGRPLPKSATDARPGSAEKVRVMAERYSRGLDITHPFDQIMDDETQKRGEGWDGDEWDGD